MPTATEILRARIGSAPPADLAAPVATAAAPAAVPTAAPPAAGERTASQILADRLAGKPADDRSWWQRNITGEGGYDPDIQELGAAKIPPGADWQVYTLPLTTSDPRARADILEKHIPGAKQSTDKYGTPVIELPGQGPDGKETRKFYPNRRGVSEADIQGFVADVATSFPAARAFAGAKGLAGVLLRGLGQGATQGVREVAAQKAGAETPASQGLLNMGGAIAGGISGEAVSNLGSKIGGLVIPAAKESVVGELFDKAKVDWTNIPDAGKQQIMSRLKGLTPGQAEAILKDPENVQNLYRDSLQTEFGQVTRGQIAGDAQRIGREAGRGLVPTGQTDEVTALLERAQSKYLSTRLLDLDGKSVADLKPASISQRLDSIIKDPDAHNLFSLGEMAELRRGKDFADMLRKKGTPSGDITYQLLQRLGGGIPALGISLGAGALGLSHGGLPHAAAALAAGTVLPAARGLMNRRLAAVAARPPPFGPAAPTPLDLSAGLLGSNLAVQSNGMGLLGR